MQMTIDEYLARRPAFHGDDYDHKRDQGRLSGQIKRVYDFMSDGQWHSLDEISKATDDPHASVSAQLRNLRKIEFGSHTVEKQHEGNGLYLYRLKV